jgi:4-hydroxybenzoate polyprenyltransferase
MKNNHAHKLRTLFITSRPVSWINTAYPFAAGYLLTIRRVDLTFVIATLFYLIPYNLLMYGVNDVYDYESDLRNPRKGGIEGAKLSKDTHLMVLTSAYLFALPFVIYLLAVSHRPWGLLIFILNIFMVLAYSLPKLRFKERPFIDSLTSSSHFVGPLIFALTFSDYKPTYGLIVLAFFLWGMASHAFGAVQDINADKAGDIGSVATVIGAMPTIDGGTYQAWLAGARCSHHRDDLHRQYLALPQDRQQRRRSIQYRLEALYQAQSGYGICGNAGANLRFSVSIV